MTSRRSTLPSSSTRCLARTRSLGSPGGLRVTQQEIPLLGGNTSTVVRVGDTVRRNVGPWTPAVHALLRHLEYVGFTGAPRVMGIDDRNREVLLRAVRHRLARLRAAREERRLPRARGREVRRVGHGPMRRPLRGITRHPLRLQHAGRRAADVPHQG